MTQINKFAGYGIAVVAALAAAVLLISTAYAAHTFTSPATASQGDTITLVASGHANGATVIFERLGTSVATGSFVANGSTSQLSCVDGAACDTDGAADGDTNVQFFISAGSPSGDLDFAASVVGGDSETDTTVVGAAAGDVANVAVTGAQSIANGGSTDVTVVVTDANDKRLAVTDIEMSVVNGTLAQDGAGDCVTIANDASTADNDTTCLIDTVTSTTAPAKVGVYENGDTGEVVKVTALFDPAAGTPVVGQLSIVIAGTASAATVTAPETLAAGATGTITVTVVDSAGNPAPDGTQVTVNASEGVVVCPATPATTTNGTVTCTYVAPGSAANVVVTAVVAKTGDDIVVTDTIAVAGGTGGGAAGSFTGTIPESGVALVTFDGGTVASLAAAAQAVGALSVSATVGGEFIVYIVGAPSFVNEAFMEAFPNGLEAGTPVILFVPES